METEQILTLEDLEMLRSKGVAGIFVGCGTYKGLRKLLDISQAKEMSVVEAETVWSKVMADTEHGDEIIWEALRKHHKSMSIDWPESRYNDFLRIKDIMILPDYEL